MKTRTEARGMGLEGLRGRDSGKVTRCGPTKDFKSSIGPNVPGKICINLLRAVAMG